MRCSAGTISFLNHISTISQRSDFLSSGSVALYYQLCLMFSQDSSLAEIKVLLSCVHDNKNDNNDDDE